MLAKEKWQIKTIAVLERVFQERIRQERQYGDVNDLLEDGFGPDVRWIPGLRRGVQPGPGLPTPENTAKQIQEIFRENYEKREADGDLPTWMHLIREEVAEFFETDPDSPEAIDEALQVAALCVSWAERKMEQRGA